MRPRASLALCVLMLSSFGLFVQPAQATRAVRVYEVAVRANTPAALEEALRAALVRATGRRDAGSDSAFGTITASPQRYVQAVRPGAQGTSVVVFDGAALDRDI